MKISKYLIMISLLSYPLSAAQDLRSDKAQGKGIATINDNFRDLSINKLDTRPGNVVPKTDNLYNLGENTYQWGKVFVGNLLALPSHAAIQGTITPDRAGELVYNSVTKAVCLSTGTTASTWVKLDAPGTVCPN